MSPLTRRGRLIRDAAFLAVIFGGGYLATAWYLSPAPLGTADHAMPRVLEQPAERAREQLAALGLRTRLDPPRAHPTIPRGAVVWQDPAPGTVLGDGAEVRLAVSAGPAPVPVPDLGGFPLPLAREVLEAAGLRAGRIDSVPSGRDGGIVLTTRPSAGQARAAGNTVDLVVSTQPPESRP